MPWFVAAEHRAARNLDIRRERLLKLYAPHTARKLVERGFGVCYQSSVASMMYF